jgi:hypothetical protein
MQIGSRSDRGADRHADSAECSQQAGLLLRSGQRSLKTASLVGGDGGVAGGEGGLGQLDPWPSWTGVDRGRWKIADEQIFSPLAGT